ncbi:MAG: DUF1292 domain-containing protein [Lachnospiraceae bacterium]
MESITFVTEDEEVEFYVLEQTTLAGSNYLLVSTNSEDEEEADCYILKEVTKDDEDNVDETMADYIFVEDEMELANISKIFEELLDDVKIEQ